jgi:hypothetical protein
MDGVRHVARLVSAVVCSPDRCPAASARRPRARTWQLVRCAAGGGARDRDFRRPRPCTSGVGMVGVRPALANPAAVRNRRGPAADTSAVASAMPPVPDTRGHVAIRRPSAGAGVTETRRRVGGRWWGVASAGGTSKPGGQAAAELAADVGHRRPGERLGLLEAEVIDLQPGCLAVPPAADDRLGDLVGVDADLGPGVLGQARSSQVRSATNTSSPGSRSGGR